MPINMGGHIERVLGFNATQMSKTLSVDYDTYGKWRRGVNKLPAIGVTAFNLLIKVNSNDQ